MSHDWEHLTEHSREVTGEGLWCCRRCGAGTFVDGYGEPRPDAQAHVVLGREGGIPVRAPVASCDEAIALEVLRS